MKGNHVQLFADECGGEVRLSDDRLRHILQRHPEMAFQLHRIAETLASPDTVGPRSPLPRSDSTTDYTRTDLRGRNRYICLVVKSGTDYSFILTAYLGRSIKGESA